jgi:hypothetical protein
VIFGALIYRICSRISPKPSGPISKIDQIALVNKVFCKFISQLRELDNSTTKRRAIWTEVEISKTAYELIRLTGELTPLGKKYQTYYASLYLCIRFGCYYSLHSSKNKIIFEKRNLSGRQAFPSIPKNHDKPYYVKGSPQCDLRLNYNAFLARNNSDVRDENADIWDSPCEFEGDKPVYRVPTQWEFKLIPNPSTS